MIKEDEISRVKAEIERVYRSLTGARIEMQIKQTYLDHLAKLVQSYEDRHVRLINKLADLEKEESARILKLAGGALDT